MSSLSKNAARNDYPPMADRIDQLLDTIGDGDGTSEMATTANEYKIKPPPGEVYVLNRALVFMLTAARIDPGEYGDQSALTNGIKITLKDASDKVIHDFTPNPIKMNGHWALLAGSDVTSAAYQAGPDERFVRWTFTKGGGPLVIDGDRGEYFSVDVRDTLANLTSHLIQVQGYKALN